MRGFPAEDLVGRTFGKWTVESRAENGPGHVIRFHCVCECGARHTVAAGTLKDGRSTGCRKCAALERHKSGVYSSKKRKAQG